MNKGPNTISPNNFAALLTVIQSFEPSPENRACENAYVSAMQLHNVYMATRCPEWYRASVDAYAHAVELCALAQTRPLPPDVACRFQFFC